MLFPIHQIIFYVFTVILIASAVMVITAKNPVKAVLCLVVSFFASAVLWMLMQAEFLALVLIFVYVGAVMTLFLFVVMMIHVDEPKKNHFVSYYPLAFLVLGVLVITAFYAFSAKHWPLANMMPTHYGPNYNNVMIMGKLMFTRYLFPFELSAVLLLVGMVSAIALAFHGKKQGTKSQRIADQLAANKSDRLRIVDMK